jgi:hypothetical protein
MSHPLRTDAPRAADALSGLERDARVEQLLLQGLDFYFTGQYESAIHVWTRVLFLDRGHARARAYIERARSAQAERQRETEELVQRGVAAFDRGDTGDARELLTAAVIQGAEPDVPLSYLGRLDRLSAVPPPLDEPLETNRLRMEPAIPVVPVAPPATASRARVALFGTLVVLALACAVWSGLALAELTTLSTAVEQRTAGAPPLPVVPPREDPLPLPRAAEIALVRARAQFEAGHVGDALRTLDTIGPADALRPAADRLRADIQRVLLATAGLADPSLPSLPRAVR